MENRPTRGSLLRLLPLIFMMIDQIMLAPASQQNNQQDLEVNRTDLRLTIETSKKFTCRDPQLRSYNLGDLMQHVPSESPVRPGYIVLKRCDSHSGCCNVSGMSCTPSEVYYEYMEIEIKSVQTNRKRNRWIKVQHHRNCTCRIITTSQGDKEPVIEILWSFRGPSDFRLSIETGSRIRECGKVPALNRFFSILLVDSGNSRALIAVN